jgi:hypothetical protein
MGINGAYIGLSLEQIAKTVLLTRSVNVIFVDLLPFVKSVIAICLELSFATFFAKLQYYAITARTKDAVFEHIERIFQVMQVSPSPLSDPAVDRNTP